jgi:hypothetical protein
LEYKSWTKNSFNKFLHEEQAVNQLEAYVRYVYFQYIIDAEKLTGKTMTLDEARTFVRRKFRKVFLDHADEWFKQGDGALLSDKELKYLFEYSDLKKIKDVIKDLKSPFYDKIIKLE